MAKWLTAQGLVDSAALDKIENEIQIEVDQAVKFAIDAPYPTVDEVDQDIYA
jgi:TPP-dependent pyruvate/acetoin dehydrogenase alpha subunit